VTQHVWTNDQPVAIPIDHSPGPDSNFGGEIQDPNGQIATSAELASAVDDFAPSIRLPEGGSFDEWSAQFATHLQGNGVARSEVASDMVFVSGCQWVQRWLYAYAHGDQASAREAMRVLDGVGRWERAAGLGNSMITLVHRMGSGDRAGIQLFENESCAFTGSWGSTTVQQDAKARGDLTPAAGTAQAYLRDGADAAAFDPGTAQGVAPDVVWTWAHMQPAPARPGAIFIADPTERAITLVSVSESGTQFCAVVTDSTVVRGTTVNDLSIVPAGDGATAATPGPVTCTPGDW
jgi:hypothetical protein